MDEGQRAKNLYIRIGAHDKDEPEIEARVKKIDVPSTWDMDEDFGWNVSDGPDAAVGAGTMPDYISIPEHTQC